MQILVAEPDRNRRGDLLNERMKELVHALGYEVTRTNIAKSGREIDLVGHHRLEDRKLVAECKAQASAVGGDAVNKFVGVVDAETPPVGGISAYFFSISGFTSAAREQEANRATSRCILMGPDEIAESLIRANVICGDQEVGFVLGSLEERAGATFHRSRVLVAHELGWLSLYQTASRNGHNGAVFIYPAGRVLPQDVAESVLRDLEWDKRTRDLRPFEVAPIEDKAGENWALSKYFEYLISEFGVIRHEGLPLDAEFGASQPIRLEELYIPQRLENVPSLQGSSERDTPDNASESEVQEVELAELLSRHPRISILGLPGAGKSTLVRRLAVAYADSTRIGDVDDDLPREEYVPIVVRCRELPESWSSVGDIFQEIAKIAELDDKIEAFLAAISRAADDGKLLILVDGLDEISEGRERKRLSAQLRTYLARHPQARLVLTSRETGYRLVSGALGEFTQSYRLCDLEPRDIYELTVAWCKHVYGNAAADSHKAENIASSILNDGRIRRLASTPLMLTMLLLIQRWSGGRELPRKRSLLYRRAVEVLLNTWNIEGHEPIELDDALPQLSYLAHEMTSSGVQRISAPDLKELILAARSAMPDVLAYTSLSPAQFIASVESRSSLLVHAGYVHANNRTDASYEFRHKMFQEYLTALALSEGWIQGDPEIPLVERLDPLLDEPEWSEVIALLCSMTGRRAVPLVRAILERVEVAGGMDDEFLRQAYPLDHLLRDLIVDDVQIPPELAADVIVEICAHALDPYDLNGIEQSRYSDLFGEIVEKGLQGNDAEFFVVAASFRRYFSDDPSFSVEDVLDRIAAAVRGPRGIECAIGLYALMNLAYGYSPNQSGYPVDVLSAEWLKEMLPPVAAIVIDGDGGELVQRHALWALAWMFDTLDHREFDMTDLRQILVELVIRKHGTRLGYYAGWVLGVTVRLRTEVELSLDGPLTERLRSGFGAMVESGRLPDNMTHDDVGLVIASYYVGEISSDRVRDLVSGHSSSNAQVIRAVFDGESD